MKNRAAEFENNKTPDLVCCQHCEGVGYTDDGKCDECWGTGLVSTENEEAV